MARMRAETAYALIIVVLMAGLAFSSYAWGETVYPALQSTCTFNSVISCAKIDNSGHTTTFGIPDWAIGIAGYVVMLALAFLAYRTYKRQHLLALTAVSGLGLVLSGYFAYLELVVIQGICPICLGAYLCNLAAFVIMVYLVRLTSDRGEPAEVSKGANAGAA
jgi:uncharacterized membrane protein